MVGQLHLARGVWGRVPLAARLMVRSFALPAGTTTFVSANVDGSVSKWEGGTDEVIEAMANIDTIFSTVVGRHGGVRPAGQREEASFLAAFARASEALACALEVQRELQANKLSCLRAGLHTGEAQVRDEVRYFGDVVARTERLRDLGHGGQVLVSRVSTDLVADHLPEGASLTDLGSHRMHDLSRPVQVYQLCHPDLRVDFPPLSSLDRYPHNLAVQLTSFVGREQAVAEVGRLLAGHGLVTLVGSGGCGKTRLALQVAAETLGVGAEEAWFVDFSGLANPELVPNAVMAAMRMQEVRGEPPTQTLTRRLAERDILIVLDNCEHLLPAAATLAEALARSCGRLALLATSRERLGVASEVVWRVPSLSVPKEQGAGDVGSVDASEAVRLFIDRARSTRPNFALTDDNAPAVAAICSRLDGIPLAIELAAARARMMSAERIAEALADRFHLLSGSTLTAIPRQATLRASVDWSYELLPEPERALLRRLSVFAGGLTLDAAEHVGADGQVGRYDVLGLLSALVDKSLVQVNEMGDRYGLLETIRAYAAEELALSGEERATRDRHLTFFVELGEQAEKAMFTSSIASWLGVLDSEHDNLRAALDWSLASGQPEHGAGLLFTISQFLVLRCLRTEGRRRCDQFLAHGLAPARRAGLYWLASGFAYFADPAASLAYGEALVALGRELGDDMALARGLARVGIVQHLSDPVVASPTLTESLAKARTVGDGVTVVASLTSLAGMNCALGLFRDALACAEEALATAQQLDYAWGVGSALGRVGQAALALGELGRASAAWAALLELGESLDLQFFIQAGHWGRGWVGIYRSEPSAAQDLAAAHEVAERTGDDVSLGDICIWQGVLALALGHDVEGCQILEQAIPVVDAFVPTSGARIRCFLAEAAIRRSELAEARSWLDGTVTLPKADDLVATRARARLARAKGDGRLAWALANEGLQSALSSGTQLLVVDFLELLALVAASSERLVKAGRLLAAASAERDRLGYVRFMVDQPDVDLAVRTLEAAMGPSGLAATWAEGAGLSVDEAVGYARRGWGQRGRPSSGWASLTPTERKVVELVAKGLTNVQIGQRMFVSVGTVKSHLNHIYDKLGVTNRHQLTGEAWQVVS